MAADLQAFLEALSDARNAAVASIDSAIGALIREVADGQRVRPAVEPTPWHWSADNAETVTTVEYGLGGHARPHRAGDRLPTY